MIAETAIFDPRHYEAVRRPLLDAETMPAWCYTSEAFYHRELERIFRKVWNFLGAADRLSAPGDYFTITFAGVPVIVLRDAEGKLRAFANPCRHRGSALLEGSGNCQLIVCPYHSWSYHLDGALAGAPEMHKTHDFDRAKHALVLLALDIWGGFLFINFDPNAAPLADYLGDLPEKVAPYRHRFDRNCGVASRINAERGELAERSVACPLLVITTMSIPATRKTIDGP